MSAGAALDASLRALRDLDDPAVVISSVPDVVLRRLAETVDAMPAAAVPLRGLTFTVKDNIDVAGVSTTAGCPSFGDVPSVSATVVDRLVAAGALPVAKVNLDQFATGLVGTRSPYGTPRNPFDPALVPGGSSSGSATSVVRGLADFSLGTDTAGSGRVPAAMCGIVGIKPTRGWLSIAGVVPAVRSIDCVSVFARELSTAWRVTDAAGAFDPADPMSRLAPPSSRAALRRVGVLSGATLTGLGVADHVRDAYEATCVQLADGGLEPIEVEFDAFLEAGALLYGGPWVAERHVSVGHHVSSGATDIDPVVREIIERAAAWTATDVHRARYRLIELRHRIEQVFAEVDVLVTPTIAREATLDEVAAEPIAANERLGRFTTFSNLADLCAATVPTRHRFAPDRPPVSVSVHGPAWSDELVAEVAAMIAQQPSVTPAVPRGWLTLAVAGAHLRGQPLEHQLVDRCARWLGTTATSADHRLYAVAGTVPPKPGLVRSGPGAGRSIEVDLWALAPSAFGDFVAQVPPPLSIGTVELSDGRTTPGFSCEPRALDGALDITDFGGWRAYRASAGG